MIAWRWLLLAALLLAHAHAWAELPSWGWLGVRIRDLSEAEMEDLSIRYGLREGYGVLIVEVLSPTTEDRDRNEKRIAYQSIPSLREYWIVSQDIPHVTRYVRDGGAWARTDYSRMEDAIDGPAIGAALTLAEIYQGVTFE